MNGQASRVQRPSGAGVQSFITLWLICAVIAIGTCVVGTRSIDVGTDTRAYATFFYKATQAEALNTRYEPAFVILTRALAEIGVGIVEYQSVLFLLLVTLAIFAARQSAKSVGIGRRSVSFTSLVLVLLYVYPVFVNAAINGVRQGLSSFPVVLALLGFQERRWFAAGGWASLAVMLHYSAFLYFPFALILRCGVRVQHVITLSLFLLYCSGGSRVAVEILMPSLYEDVMNYGSWADYRTGTRYDFAVFTVFWYVLAVWAERWTAEPVRQGLVRLRGVYLVLTGPFFILGFGAFSNRLLLTAWLMVSVLLAAMLSGVRVHKIRSPLFSWLGLIVAGGIFAFLVSKGVVI